MKPIRMLFIILLVSATLVLSASAVKLQHDVDYYAQVGAACVIRAAYDADGKFLSCRWQQVAELENDNWSADGAESYKEFALTESYYPLHTHRYSYNFLNEWQIEWRCTTCGEVMETIAYPEYEGITYKSFTKLSNVQKMAIEDNLGESLYNQWVLYLKNQQEAIEYNSEV